MKAVFKYLIIILLFSHRATSLFGEEPQPFQKIYLKDSIIKDANPSQMDRGIWDFQKYLKLKLAGAGDIYINSIFGSLTLSRTDISLPSAYFPNEIKFTYNSGSSFSGRYGSGWTLNYNMRYIENSANDNVIIAGADDRTSLFVKNPNGSFAGKNGITDSLIALEEGYKLIVWKDKQNNAGDYSEYYFDSKLHPYPTKIFDRNGNRILLEYNENNELVSIDYPSGRNLILHYDQNMLTSISYGVNNLAGYFYNERGQLIEVVYPGGRRVKYFYDNLCQKLTSIENSLGGRVNIVYNSDLTISAAEYPQDTAKYVFDYDFQSRTTSFVDPLGNKRKYGFDSLYRLSYETSPDNKTIQYEWKDYNLAKISHDYKSDISYEYDFRGNITRERSFSYDKVFFWDYSFNKLYKITRNGTEITYPLDSKGNLLELNNPQGKISISYDAQGKAVNINSGKFKTYSYSYDTKGSLKEINGAAFIHFEYDDFGNIVKISQQDISHDFAYNNSNRIISYKNPFGGIRLFEYDSIGKLSKINYENGAVEYYKSDYYGRLAFHITRDNDTIPFLYDKLSNLIKSGLGDACISFQYNSLSLIEKIINASGVPIAFTYDDDRRIISYNNAINKSVQYEYNDYGMLSKVKNESGYLSFKYDEDGKLISKSLEDGSQYKYSYSPEGNLINIDYNNIYNYAFKYDDDNYLSYIKIKDNEYILQNLKGNLVQLTENSGRDYQFSYNLDGSLKELINPKGLKYSFNYEKGFISSIDNIINLRQNYYYNTSGQLSQIDINKKYDFSYDNYGRISSIIYPNSSKKIFKYDTRGYIKEFINRENNSFKYFYKLGLLSSLVNPDSSYYSYNYDSEGNIISASNYFDDKIILNYNDDKIIHISDPLKRQLLFSYDKKRNLTSLNSNNSQLLFAYDALNRITSVRPPESGSYTFNYKDFDVAAIIDPYQQKTTITRGVFGIDKISYPNGDSTAFNYLDKGYKVLAKFPSGLILNYTYDPLFRLTDITNNYNEGFHYNYDSYNNLMIKKDENEGISTYARDIANNIVKISSPSNDEINLKYNNENNIIQINDASDIPYAIEWDKLERIVKIKSTNSSEYSRIFDKAENINSIINPNSTSIALSYDASGKMIFMRNPKNELYSYLYDLSGNLKEIIFPERNRTSFLYDKADRIVSVKLLGTEALTFEYDRNGNLISRIDPKGLQYSYNRSSTGKITTITDPLGNSINILYKGASITGITDEIGNRHNYIRDALGRKLSENGTTGQANYFYNKDGGIDYALTNRGDTLKYSYYPSRLLKGKFNEFDNDEYEYDYSGNLIKYNHNGIISLFNYDNAGNILNSYLPGYNLKFTWDKLNNLKSISNGIAEIKLEYDMNNLLSNIKSPVFYSINISRNKNGEITGIISDDYSYNITRDGIGRIKSRSDNFLSGYSFYYDVASNISSIETPNDSIISNFYVGNLLSGITGLKASYTYEYKPDRMLSKASLNSGEGMSQDFAYNNSLLVNHRIKTNDAYFNHGVDLTYNSVNDLTGVSHTLPGKENIEYLNERIISLGKSGKIKIDYNNGGLISAIRFPNGLTEARKYDSVGKLNFMALYNLSDTVYKYKIDYSSQSISVTGDDTLLIRTDSAGRIKEAFNPNERIQITYNKYGDRLETKINNSAEPYIYENGRLVQAGSTKFEYDKAGNITKKITPDYETKNSFDSFNRLIKVELPGKEVIFEYSATGELYKIISGTFSHRMDSRHKANSEVDEKTGIIFEAGDKGLYKENYYFYDSTLNINNFYAYYDSKTGKDFYVHYDYAGRARFISNESGETAALSNMDVLGHADSALAYSYMYKGMLFDSVSGLFYDGKRFYDPSIGRYINLNMDFDSKNINPYVFADNNPINYAFNCGNSYEVPQFELLTPYLMDYSQPFLNKIENLNSNVILESYLDYYKKNLFRNFENYGIVLNVDYKNEDDALTKATSSITSPRIFNLSIKKYEDILPGFFDKYSIKRTYISASPALPKEMEIEFEQLAEASAFKLNPMQIISDYNSINKFPVELPAPLNIFGAIAPEVRELFSPKDYLPKAETAFEPFVELGSNIKIPALPYGEINLMPDKPLKYRKSRMSDISMNSLILDKENAINKNISEFLSLRNILYTSSEISAGFLHDLEKLIAPVKMFEEMNAVNRTKVSRLFLPPVPGDEIPGISAYVEEDPLYNFAMRKRPKIESYFIEKTIKAIHPDGKLFYNDVQESFKR